MFGSSISFLHLPLLPHHLLFISLNSSKPVKIIVNFLFSWKLGCGLDILGRYCYFFWHARNNRNRDRGDCRVLSLYLQSMWSKLCTSRFHCLLCRYCGVVWPFRLFIIFQGGFSSFTSLCFWVSIPFFRRYSNSLTSKWQCCHWF